MSTVRDRNVIDITYIEGDKFILEICDDLEWFYGFRVEHATILQDKINDYLDYISSGQAGEAQPGKRPVIRVFAKYSYSAYCLDFLERIKAFIKQNGDICDFEWTHSTKDGPFNDGFSDDYVFDARKIYPRVRKNWAKDPLKEISLLATGPNANDYDDQYVMLRFMDKFVGMFVQDLGNAFTYIRYPMLPEGMDVDELQKIAFENLARDITYRSVESREEGVYGIVCGGNFEAESICNTGIWQDVSKMIGDDVIVCIPTKDIVLYTKANDKKLRKKILKMAEEMFEKNRHETPYLIFGKDVLIYTRADDTLKITDKYSY